MEELSANLFDTNFESNYSEKAYDDLYVYFRTFLCIITIIVNFSVVLSSGLLLLKGQEPRSTYIFLGNISLADMVLGMITLFLLFYPHQLSSEIACSVSISLAITATMVSVFSIGLIGIDRYLYILYGLHYQTYITPQRSHCMVLSTWLVCGLLGFTSVFGWRNYMNEKQCWFSLLVPPKLVLVLASVGIIPMLLILVLYSIILKNILNRISRLNCAANSDVGNHDGGLRMFRGRAKSSARMSTIYEEHDESIRIQSFGLPCCRKNNSSLKISSLFCESKWKAIKVVVFTAGAFFVTWFPYFVASVFYAFCDFNLHPKYCMNIRLVISSPLSTLSFCNSLLNPLIYAWWHNGFRDSVKKMYHKIFVKRFQMQQSEQIVKSKVNKTDSIRRTEPENFDNEQRF